MLFGNISHKQEHILEQAEILFAKKGYNATSVRDIARAAKVNVAMISYYFGSKEKLMVALFTNRMKTAYALIEGLATNNELTAMQKIEMLVDSYVHKIISKKNFYRVSFVEQLINCNETVLNLMHKYKKQYAETLEKIIAEGLANGEFLYTYDPVLLLNTLNGTIVQSNININFYKKFNKTLHKSPLEFEKEYYEKVASHVKLILKRILGYDENK